MKFCCVGKGHAHLVCQRNEGLFYNRQVLLHVANKLHFAWSERRGGFSVGLGVAWFTLIIGASSSFNVKPHANFKKSQRWESPRDFRSRELVQAFQGGIESKSAEWRNGNGVPEIEFVVAPVVVAHAGVLVDDANRFVKAIGRNFCCDKAGGVTEAARVKNRADLADDPVCLELADVLDDLMFLETAAVSEVGKRSLSKRNFLLEEA